MKKALIISVLAMVFSFSQAHCFERSFMPENKLKISVGDKLAGDMTQGKFESIIYRAYLAYAPIFWSKGAVLQVDRDWYDWTVNAYSYQTGNIWHVVYFGGLARHPLVTDDGFLLVVCHEIGHHVGGAPKMSDYANSWASKEGQTDYFTTLKCMKRVLEKDDNISIVSKMFVDAEATKQCQTVYKNAEEVALCQRIAMAGKSLGMLLASFEGTQVAFDTPDRSVVNSTYDYHPRAQCRLDTYFQGALCDKSFTEDVSDTSPIPGTCVSRDGYKVGLRPLCWYKPDACEI